MVNWNGKVTNSEGSLFSFFFSFFFVFFCFQLLCLVVWPRLDDPFVSLPHASLLRPPPNSFLHWYLSDRESPQVSRTLLSILIDLNNAVVCMFSFLLLISSLSSVFSRFLGIVVRALTILSLSSCTDFSVVCWKRKIYYVIGSFLLMNQN